MCDFHSCCIRVDGALAHVAENSHSSAALAEVTGYVYVQQGATFTAPKLNRGGAL